MTPDIQELIAELEEAERAATPGPWENSDGILWVSEVEYGMEAVCCGNFLRSGECCGNAVPVPTEEQVQKQIGGASKEDARLIALMRTRQPTLREAVKRQGEALEKIALIGDGHGETAYDFERILDMRDIARAALKEATDV